MLYDLMSWRCGPDMVHDLELTVTWLDGGIWDDDDWEDSIVAI